MNFYLKAIAVSNFKGIRHFETTLTHQSDILGANKAGKTTLKDAFLWCLFGKDSTGRTDFSIKPLQENNEPIHKVDSEVQLWAMADDRDIHIRRVYREEWVTKRGSRTQELKGHKQEFFWDEVPLKESDFQARVNSLISESTFRLLTSTGYFNSLSKAQMREHLLKISGQITDSAVMETLVNDGIDYSPVIQNLNRGKTLEEYRKQISQKIKDIKEQLDLVPSRIDEASRSLSAIPQHDYAAMEHKLQALQDREKIITGQLSDLSEKERMRQISVAEKIKDLYQLKSDLNKIEYDIKEKTLAKARQREAIILDKKNQLRTKLDFKSREMVDLATHEKRSAGLQVAKDELATKWEALDRERIEFKEGELRCDKCGRDYDGELLQSHKDTLIASFNNDKARRLKALADEGMAKKTQIQSLQLAINTSKLALSQASEESESLTTEIAELERLDAECKKTEAVETVAYENDSEYKAIQEMIKLKTEEIENPEPKTDEDLQLIKNREAIRTEIDETNKILGTKQTREVIEKRISELNDQEKNLAKTLSEYEGIDFAIDKFNRAKMDLLEARVNGRFQIVKFKMFEKQLNGGEVDTCITLIDGVPYQDANTAAKVQAGIDIINVFSEHYGLYAPIWVDNRESVLDLPETKSQLINLFVSDKYKKLSVQNREMLVDSK